MFRSTCLALACLAFVASPTAGADTPSAPAYQGPVTTFVMIKTPPSIKREQIDVAMKEAIPLYEKIPGLIRKYFVVNADSFGGMYLWKDKASADAWYHEGWRAQVKATYGSDPTLIFFDSPVQVDNSAKAAVK
jgi:hypothetical protein